MCDGNCKTNKVVNHKRLDTSKKYHNTDNTITERYARHYKAIIDIHNFIEEQSNYVISLWKQ